MRSSNDDENGYDEVSIIVSRQNQLIESRL